MYSRAHLLIERDSERLSEDSLWGIEAYPVTYNSLFEWTVKIFGERGTAWEGGVFRLHMKFSEFYNNIPPSINFHTIPFHPNVNPSNGQPQLDIVSDVDKWNPEENYFGHILLAVQTLLSKPNLERPVNLEAAEVLMKYPKIYEETTRQCVLSSQAIEAEFYEGSVQKFKFPIELNEHQRNSSLISSACKHLVVKKKLAFEDYFASWTDMATSKSLKSPSKSHAVNELSIPTTDCNINFDKEVDDLISWTDKLNITS